MGEFDSVDFGPLEKLISVSSGSKGEDVSPEPDGNDHNPYYETTTYISTIEVDNADSEELVGIFYCQFVCRKRNHKVFHDQTGYWLWESKTDLIIHTFSIPRKVALVAGSSLSTSSDQTTLNVEANIDNEDWATCQSLFMQDHEKTTPFE